jgi:Cellulase (glycosyl hydrolase family 5)
VAQHQSESGPTSGGFRLRLVVGVVVGVLLLTAAGCGQSGSSGGGSPAPAAPYVQDGPMPAISVAGSQILRGGQPWWFLGFNSFSWSGDCGGPGEDMSTADVDAWFASMRHDGHGAVRLFFFPGWDLSRLDAAIASAKRNNVYVTITLDNGIEGCGAEQKTAEWFADSEKRAVYADHMTALLQRYKGDPTIAWFEYFNEPSYADGALRQFYDEMGELADTVDPERLFSAGTIATYALDGDDNFRNLNESSGVDIASLHEYDADEIESHWGPEVLANSAGKPVIVGEFGIYASTSGIGDPGDGQACQADLTQRQTRIQEKADVYIDTQMGYAGALAWAWQPGNSLDKCVTGNLASDLPVQEILRVTGAN